MIPSWQRRSYPNAAVAASTVWKGLGLALGAALVFAVAVAGGYELTTWDRVAPGVSVLDVPVGGLTLEQAQARIAPRTQTILDQQLTLQLDDRTWQTSARSLGVRLDATRLAESAYVIGRDDSPLTRLRAQLDGMRRGVDVPVVEEADGARLDRLVASIAAEVNKPAREAHLSLSDSGEISFGTSETGLLLDQPASRAQIVQALTTGGAQSQLVYRVLTPALTTGQVAAAHEQLERILGTQPVRLTAAEYSRAVERRGRAAAWHVLVQRRGRTNDARGRLRVGLRPGHRSAGWGAHRTERRGWDLSGGHDPVPVCVLGRLSTRGAVLAPVLDSQLHVARRGRAGRHG